MSEEAFPNDEGTLACVARMKNPAPSQSDEERARDLAFVGCGCSEEESERCPDMGMCCRRPSRLIAEALASVRAEATLAEREACAKVVEGIMVQDWRFHSGNTRNAIAAAIRARK